MDKMDDIMAGMRRMTSHCEEEEYDILLGMIELCRNVWVALLTFVTDEFSYATHLTKNLCFSVPTNLHICRAGICEKLGRLPYHTLIQITIKRPSFVERDN